MIYCGGANCVRLGDPTVPVCVIVCDCAIDHR